MNDGISLIMTLAVLFAGFCCLMVLSDIVKTVYHQFKGDAYEWYTVKVFKERREWWKWVLAAGMFAIGLYCLLPNSLVGQEDFRAFRQKPEYTAYYKCEYEINHFGNGTGYAELKREDSQFTIVKVYTDDGYILLNYTLTEDDDLDYGINLSFCSEWDSSVILVGDPVQPEIAQVGYNKEIFGYPDPTKEYCRSCRTCGAGYYSQCIDGSTWLCPSCTEKCQTSCDICFERCPLWYGSKDDYVICEYCLSTWFCDEDLRYYFRTGEWS